MINEGLSRHSLRHLVMPIVSIDEYESKIDDRRVIVTAFYVRDQDPAGDLSSFIEKSSIRPLDTEVSPAPTDDGWYVVFVEMGRDDDYPKRLVDMLDQIGNLTDTMKWSFKAYGSKGDELHDVDEKNIREHVNLDPEKVEIEDDGQPDGSDEAEVAEPVNEAIPIAEQIGSFMRASLCDSVEIRGDHIRLNNRSGSRVYRVVSIGTDAPSTPVISMDIGDPMLKEAMILQTMLGPGYVVDSGDGIVLVDDGARHLILSVDR